MLASQSFITSVVVGKDIVPRIGLHQLEMLRHQLVETLHKSNTAKVGFSHNIPWEGFLTINIETSQSTGAMKYSSVITNDHHQV